MRTVLLYIGLGVFLSASSCNKESEQPVSYPNLLIQFDHYYDGQPFALNTKYTTQNQDTIDILEHKYIVSNIILRNNQTGAEKEIENSYYLVKVPLDGNSHAISIAGASANLGNGNWDEIEFLIGLDSATNFAPEGAPKLFADEGMFWEWNTGYKFYVTEGRYYSASLPNPFAGVIAHIGDMNNLISVSIDLGANGGLSLQGGKTSGITLDVNVDELFFNPNLIDLSDPTFQQVMGGNPATIYRQNYSNNYWNLNSIQNP